MRSVRVPALQRTRVAHHVAKRMPMTVTLEVEGAAADGDAVAGLVEVEKGFVPFVNSLRSEAALKPSQAIEIGAMYASFAVYVTSETSITMLVEVRASVRTWLLLVGAGSIVVMGLAIYFLTL